MQGFKKVLITGNAGAGKTTLSKKLSKALSIEAYSLDKIVWKPRWCQTDPIEKAHRIAEITSLNEWIIDGVSKDALVKADTIIFLDFPRHVLFWRVFKRNIRYLFKSRPELPEDCFEICIVFKLIKIIWNFPSQFKPMVIEHFRLHQSTKNIFHIRSNAELQNFIVSVGYLP